MQVSPNVEPRASGAGVRYLILHYTGMSSAALAVDWLCRSESRVSCHYLVDDAGKIFQMVNEELRAWHAGVSRWHGDTDLNSLSVGIEIQNTGHSMGYPDFGGGQMEAVAALSQDIVTRHGILPRNVLAHSDIAPGRKIDPGEKFDWHFLFEKGVGHWVPPEPVGAGVFLQQGDAGDGVTALQGMLKMYGYGLEVNGTYDERTRIVLAAFQRHFRPAKVDGVADVSTVTTLHRLLAALAVS
ncbi:MAG: N-acetylmuramoyl-L-alanine amidase [Hyphomicrobiales bacterium]